MDKQWKVKSTFLNNCNEYLFSDLEPVKQWEYINGGFQIVNKNHKQFFQDIISFYFVNQDNLIKVQETFHTGTDQTPVNMLVHQRGLDLKLLPYEFNMNDMARKEILGDDLLFTKIGWIYQYNAIPNNKDNELTNYFMKKTYEHFYGELKD